MKDRTLVIGDIHGGLLALKEVFSKSNVTSDDTLIFLGDYVDGWSQSPDVIDFLLKYSQTNNCIFIRGNHDELLLEWLEKSNPNFNETTWFKHGGQATAMAYQNLDNKTIDLHINFLKSLKNYYIDANNRLFIHAGFTNLNGVTFEYFPKLYYWDRTLWETALSLDPSIAISSPYYPKRFTHYKEIFIGHTPVTRIDKTTPVNLANVWNIDTGAGFLGPLTIIDVATKEYWQSEPLNVLYPNEKGRN